MDPTIDAMLVVYAATLKRHQQHLDDGCDRRAWHGRPLPWNPNVFNQNDH
jgi:hypothetical protein